MIRFFKTLFTRDLSIPRELEILNFAKQHNKSTEFAKLYLIVQNLSLIANNKNIKKEKDRYLIKHLQSLLQYLSLETKHKSKQPIEINFYWDIANIPTIHNVLSLAKQQSNPSDKKIEVINILVNRHFKANTIIEKFPQLNVIPFQLYKSLNQFTFLYILPWIKIIYKDHHIKINIFSNWHKYFQNFFFLIFCKNLDLKINNFTMIDDGAISLVEFNAKKKFTINNQQSTINNQQSTILDIFSNLDGFCSSFDKKNQIKFIQQIKKTKSTKSLDQLQNIFLNILNPKFPEMKLGETPFWNLYFSANKYYPVKVNYLLLTPNLFRNSPYYASIVDNINKLDLLEMYNQLEPTMKQTVLQIYANQQDYQLIQTLSTSDVTILILLGSSLASNQDEIIPAHLNTLIPIAQKFLVQQPTGIIIYKGHPLLSLENKEQIELSLQQQISHLQIISPSLPIEILIANLDPKRISIGGFFSSSLITTYNTGINITSINTDYSPVENQTFKQLIKEHHHP